MCIRCSGIHRHLGVHISFVRSVNLDSWTEEQVRFMEAWGNNRAGLKYAANGCPSKPSEADNVHVVTRYIKDKYMHKRYMSAEEPPANAPVAQAEAPAANGAAPRQAANRRVVVKVAQRSMQPQGAALQPVQAAAPAAAAAPAPVVDLLSFDTPAAPPPAQASAVQTADPIATDVCSFHHAPAPAPRSSSSSNSSRRSSRSSSRRRSSSSSSSSSSSNSSKWTCSAVRIWSEGRMLRRERVRR